MTKRLNISISDVLHDTLEDVKTLKPMNVSKICQEALEKAILEAKAEEAEKAKRMEAIKKQAKAGNIKQAATAMKQAGFKTREILDFILKYS